VTDADAKPKPALRAAQTLERLLGSRTLVGRVPTTVEDANTSFVLGFTAPSADGLPSAAKHPDLDPELFAVWYALRGQSFELERYWKRWRKKTL